VKLGVAIPQIFVEGPVNVPLLRRFLARAESLGYHSAWVQEHTLGTAVTLDPLTLLGYASALTDTLKLGTAVLIAGLRDPVHLAKSLATLDHLSGGRLLVGVGLGGSPRMYPAFGLTADRRVRRFTESIALMKLLWTGTAGSFQGEFFHLDRGSLEPKPLQQPHPPIWVGAHHPAALRRAVRLGDGWIGAGSSSTVDFKTDVQIVRRSLAEARREPSTFTVAKRVYIAVDENRTRAEARLMRCFGVYYGDAERAKRVAVYGDEHECAEKLYEIASAGAELLILNPLFDEMEHLDRVLQVTSSLPASDP